MSGIFHVASQGSNISLSLKKSQSGIWRAVRKFMTSSQPRLQRSLCLSASEWQRGLGKPSRKIVGTWNHLPCRRIATSFWPCNNGLCNMITTDRYSCGIQKKRYKAKSARYIRKIVMIVTGQAGLADIHWLPKNADVRLQFDGPEKSHDIDRAIQT